MAAGALWPHFLMSPLCPDQPSAWDHPLMAPRIDAQLCPGTRSSRSLESLLAGPRTAPSAGLSEPAQPQTPITSRSTRGHLGVMATHSPTAQRGHARVRCACRNPGSPSGHCHHLTVGSHPCWVPCPQCSPPLSWTPTTQKEGKAHPSQASSGFPRKRQEPTGRGRLTRSPGGTSHAPPRPGLTHFPGTGHGGMC